MRRTGLPRAHPFRSVKRPGASAVSGRFAHELIEYPGLRLAEGAEPPEAVQPPARFFGPAFVQGRDGREPQRLIPVSLGHLDGAEMVKLMAWAQGVFTFDPEAVEHIAGAHPIFKLHVFLGLTIFVIFPFTRLVHMLSVPIRYLWRPGYQVVRARPASRSGAGRGSSPAGNR